jgi:hypothetical protein
MTAVERRRNDFVATVPSVRVLAQRNLVRLMRMPSILVPMVVTISWGMSSGMGPLLIAARSATRSPVKSESSRIIA